MRETIACWPCAQVKVSGDGVRDRTSSVLISKEGNIPNIAVVCPTVWDADELRRLCARFDVRFEFIGGSTGSSSTWVSAALDRLWLQNPIAIAQKAGRKGLSGVFSTDDDIGAALAAAIAERLALPSACAAAVLRAQNKLISRRIAADIDADATPGFALLSRSKSKQPTTYAYPVFVKPIRGTLSVLAGVASSYVELERMTKLGVLQRLVWRQRMRPFKQMFERYVGEPFDVDGFLVEQVVNGRHLSVEGYCQFGEPAVLGIVEAQMYSGTISFKRFDYPAHLGDDTRRRASALAAAIARRLGLRDSLFEVEMFFDESTDRLWVIEVNPRMCAQFADLFEKVDGHNLYEIQMAVALGRKPGPRQPSQYQTASSYVFRSFAKHDVLSTPATDAWKAVESVRTDARIRVFSQHRGLRTVSTVVEDRASQRVAVINVGGAARKELDETVAGIAQSIGLRFARSSRVHRELIAQE